MFTSTITSISFVDHAVSAFGIDAANATVSNNSWGDMLHIAEGEFAGSYDIHSNGGVVKFIAA